MISSLWRRRSFLLRSGLRSWRKCRLVGATAFIYFASATQPRLTHRADKAGGDGKRASRQGGKMWQYDLNQVEPYLADSLFCRHSDIPKASETSPMYISVNVGRYATHGSHGFSHDETTFLSLWDIISWLQCCQKQQKWKPEKKGNAPEEVMNKINAVIFGWVNKHTFTLPPSQTWHILCQTKLNSYITPLHIHWNIHNMLMITPPGEN